MKIGFVGVGVTGRPMAGHLQVAGHQLVMMQHRSALPKELLEGGAIVCASARELAAQSDVVILMLPDTPDVEAVLLGAAGVADGLKPDTCVIDMSSIDPLATRRLAQRVEALGCDYVDAPVSGGEVGAEAGTLTIMCGAKEAAFEKIRPILSLMGKNVIRVGEVGAGQVAKVANQIVVALNIEAVAEALLFASKAGVDPGKVREALMGGFAASRVLEVHGQRMIDRTFEAGFRIALHQKDLNLALSGARELGMALPNTATVQQLFSRCVALRSTRRSPKKAPLHDAICRQSFSAVRQRAPIAHRRVRPAGDSVEGPNRQRDHVDPNDALRSIVTLDDAPQSKILSRPHQVRLWRSKWIKVTLVRGRGVLLWP